MTRTRTCINRRHYGVGEAEEAIVKKYETPPILPSVLGKMAIPCYQYPKHIQVLEKTVMDLLFDPNINRQIIRLPIRHGKSWFCSYILPAWHLLNFPNKKVFIVSYGTKFSMEWTSRIRSIIYEFGPRFGVELDSTFKAIDHFRLEKPHTGDCRGLGAAGALSGKGYDLLCIDDPVKDFEEVATPEQRDKLFTRFHSEIMSRGEPGSKILFIMSSRHPQDLSSRLMSQNDDLEEKDKWHDLTMPAISINDKGEEEALWPERWPLKKLQRTRNDFELAGQSFLWSCLYQNDPRTNSEFLEWPSEWFDDIFYDERPDTKIQFHILSLDPALGSDKKKGDFSALLHTIYDVDGNLWVEDSLMRRTDSEATENNMIDWLEKFKPDAAIIEANSFQRVLATNIERKAKAKKLVIPLYTHQNQENKEVRIRMTLTPFLDRRKIKFRKTTDNKIGVNSQMRDWPEVRHEDFLDSLELTIRMINHLLVGRRQEPNKLILRV